MFEITSDDIAALNDEDLRTLIGLLCEAELRRSKLPVSAVTWGGNQTAKDGGVDVRVALPFDTVIEGFIARPATGFQVKKPDMPPSEIAKEMRPKGELRPVIVELAATSGAYIIVSSNGSTADSALDNRRSAMREAVQDVADAARLHLDFYDRNRVASWVRDHPGLIPWVRSRIGKSVPGWRSFGAWSVTPGGVDTSYLLDSKARIKTGNKDDGDGLPLVAGIDRIRSALRQPGQVVRLVGLSGVGKTRLVEALFDDAVGTGALDPSLAIYADTADAPDPQPRGLASDLLASRTRAIIVVDNCPPETHRQLSEVARGSGSTISIITVEYDIREDQPEGTDVYSLETSSVQLIEELIRRRFPHVSQIDAGTIAEFSGGNARIALALAGTVNKTDTVSGLANTELFTRLFQQRHDHDADLLQIAEACSLVYSFEGEALAGENAELPVLGGLIGKTARDLFAAVAELKRRDLLQTRGEGRAVLPHAIANRLAARALQHIPYAVIEETIVNGPSDRLLRSFSRRLGFLDESSEAQEIVRSWLEPGGLLADVLNLTELGRAMFENVAPVSPEATLSALEHAFTAADREDLPRAGHFVRLLRSLAYDPALFERAVRLLRQLAGLHDDDDSGNEAAKTIVSLFYISLSGTHAPLQMRLRVLETLLDSRASVDRQLGLKAVEAMLETDHFSSFSSFEFGARSRDYGYHPRSLEEIGSWFQEVLGVAERLALSNGAMAAPIRKIIAQQFRGLWRDVRCLDALDRIARAIASRGFWRDGWVAARQTRQFDGTGLEADSQRRLTELEEFLRPKDLIENVRGIVLGAEWDLYAEGPEDDEGGNFDKRRARAIASVEKLGRDVAVEETSFTTLLPELIGAQGQLFQFGRGLAAGSEDPRAIWDRLVAQIRTTEEPNVQVLGGFLNGLWTRDEVMVQTLLDESVEDTILGQWFPTLQTCIKIDERGTRRLHRALEVGVAPISQYYGLVFGGACDPIPALAFRDLVLAIADQPDGHWIGLEILSMRLHSDKMADREPLSETIETGCRLLAQYRFERNSNRARREDYRLGVVVRSCLVGAEGTAIARALWRDLKAAIDSYDAHAGDYDDLVKALFEVQPSAMLDELVVGSEKDREKSIAIIRDASRHRQNPTSSIPDDLILAWCDSDPEIRYPFVAALVLLFARPDEKAALEWRPITQQLLARAPDPVAVFKPIGERLWPTSFSGSIASKYESRLQLLDKLDPGIDAPLIEPFNKLRSQFATRVEKARSYELSEEREQSGRFE